MKMVKNLAGYKLLIETNNREQDADQNYTYSAARCLLYSFIWSFIFVGTAVLARHPAIFDNDLVIFLNKFSNKSKLMDNIAYWMYQYYSLSGVVALSIIWGSWLSTDDLVAKARILSAVIVAAIAGLVSRFLQHSLITHSRPYHSADIAFVAPSVSSPWLLNTWNSFPSDTATVWGGLTIATMIANRKLGFALAPWIAVVLITRIYLGAHYLTDLIGGVALSGLLIFLFQSPIAIYTCLSIQNKLIAYKNVFYMVSFFISFQIATLFSDIRSMFGSNFLKMLFG